MSSILQEIMLLMDSLPNYLCNEQKTHWRTRGEGEALDRWPPWGPEVKCNGEMKISQIWEKLGKFQENLAIF